MPRIGDIKKFMNIRQCGVIEGFRAARGLIPPCGEQHAKIRLVVPIQPDVSANNRKREKELSESVRLLFKR